MSKKDKDFFEQILDDVRPLKKTKTILKKYQIDLKNYDKILLKKDTKKKQTNIKTKIKLQEKNIIDNDPAFAKKIKKRKILINKKVDLHGFSLSEAEKEFDNTIQSCYSENIRCILFVTGKGLKNTKGYENENKLYYGKIKIATPPLNNAGLRLVTLQGEHKDLIDTFNRGLTKLRQNGVYDKLLKKWELY